MNQNLRSNEQIRLSPIRLIDQNEQQIGVIETAEAMRMARDAGLDLVEVAPTARPPVCRIMDYGKWKYAQKKKQKKHHEQQLKEVRLRPKTDANDRRIKIRRAIQFFAKGSKVQFTMQFRGRERFHREIAFEIFEGILQEFGDQVKVDRRPSMEGRVMIMILTPVKGAFTAETVGDKPASQKAAEPAGKAENITDSDDIDDVDDSMDIEDDDDTSAEPESDASSEAGETTQHAHE
ncbi:MAG: translation initiation factor IF-3 [Phycisphaerae bacterium]|nr:translation initiation factor IF-3 [Phycisphaerae bacterium]